MAKEAIDETQAKTLANKCKEMVKLVGGVWERKKQIKKAGRCTPFAPHAFCGRQDVGRGAGIAVPTKQGAGCVQKKQIKGEESETKRTQH